ncbi:hypothetical protein HXX01_03870 [Candidatus Nomurabacteria bacterium]|nr:hypothetical protein [Candidatus Nomurabacteria bacterium]
MDGGYGWGPSSPKTWGALDKIGKISPDNKSVTFSEQQTVSVKGIISANYDIAIGDPAGIYELKVIIDDKLVKNFNFILK